MTSITDPLICRVLVYICFFTQISFYRTTKYIVRSSIITNNSPKLPYDAVILKDREKTSELLVSAMVYYRTKCKEGL